MPRIFRQKKISRFKRLIFEVGSRFELLYAVLQTAA